MDLEVLKEAINTYGEFNQMNMAIEEMSELTKAICKLRRASNELRNANFMFEKLKIIAVERKNIIEEVADCLITFEQLKMIFNCEDEVNEQIDFKINRLKERLNNERLP